MDYECIIVGGGPAGLSAGLYLVKAGVKTLLVEGRTPGGQILNTDRVDNFLGFGEIEAWKLADAMIDHCRVAGLEIIAETVEEAGPAGDLKEVRFASGRTLSSRALVLACGGSPRKLGVPGEEELSKGKGVSYCAVCDGGFFRGQAVAIAGGGDGALTEARHLAHLTEHVYVIHRRDQWRAKSQLAESVINLENVTPVLDSVVISVAGGKESGAGEERVKAVKIKNVKTGKESEIAVTGFFVAIGFVPNSGLFRGEIEKNEEGYFVTDSLMRTSVPGVFAVGDVRAHIGRQIAISVGDGATASLAVARYLAEGR